MSSGGPVIVQVFDGILGKEVALPLVDANYAVDNFPSRYSFVIANPFGHDNPLPPTGLPSTSTLLAFELTVMQDNVLNVLVTMGQIDAVFAIVNFPTRYSWVSGAPVPGFPIPGPPVPIIPPIPPAGDDPMPNYLGSFTVATLPVSPAAFSTATATNGRKIGEGPGAGTGVLVYFSSGVWRVFSLDQPVTS